MMHTSVKKKFTEYCNVIHFILRKITVTDKAVIDFSLPILEYKEGCLKDYSAGHFQPLVYFVASFLFPTKLKSLTHKDIWMQTEIMHRLDFLLLLDRNPTSRVNILGLISY